MIDLSTAGRTRGRRESGNWGVEIPCQYFIPFDADFPVELALILPALTRFMQIKEHISIIIVR
jgi:hypothetical protein